MGLSPPGPPKPRSSDPRVRLRGRITVSRKIIGLSTWVEEENRHGEHVCACGCNAPIRVLPRHRAKGIPKYLWAHHPMAMTQETRRLRAEGLLTSGVVARELGVSFTTLWRLEGKLFEPVPREGKRGFRVFTPEQVEQIREALRKTTHIWKVCSMAVTAGPDGTRLLAKNYSGFLDGTTTSWLWRQVNWRGGANGRLPAGRR